MDYGEVLREFENMWASQHAEYIASKHTEDCIYIHQDLGILRGRKGKGHLSLADYIHQDLGILRGWKGKGTP